MRCISRVGPANQPFGGDGDDRLLHGIEHRGQLLAAALDLGKALSKLLGGFVQRGLRRWRAIFFGRGKAGAQIAAGNAPRKGNHPLQTRGDAAGNPYRQSQRHGQRDQAGAQNLIAEKTRVWPGAVPIPCRQ